MSLRLVVLALILTTAAALGLIAYQIAAPVQAPATHQVSEVVPLAVGYLVAGRALPAGTLMRDEDIVVKLGSTMPDPGLCATARRRAPRCAGRCCAATWMPACR